MGNKTGLITPFLMLVAGAIASIIMYVRGFGLYRMLWWLLIILLIFYVIGDTARYLYATIRPRIIPAGNLEKTVSDAKKKSDLMGNVVAFSEGDEAEDESDDEISADGFISEDAGYSDEELSGYDDSADNYDEENTDEN